IIEPQNTKLSQIIQYVWKIDGITDKPPQLLEETCQPTRFMRLAALADGGLGTVVGVYVPADGKPQRVSLEWSSGKKEFDDDSIEYLQSCKFQPATNNGKNVDGSISFRLFPQNVNDR
ncbi:MAG: energy transducer TonB, partial [Burkholderiales bacterium]|nr:energy transducer TonB [Burkholderiales bacterium]